MASVGKSNLEDSRRGTGSPKMKARGTLSWSVKLTGSGDSRANSPPAGGTSLLT